jgi:hypothetical protein
MAMTPKLFTISGAAVELGVDRRTVAAALADVVPDGKVGKIAAWRLRTVLRALGVRLRGSSNMESTSADLDELERLNEVLTEGFKRVEAEPDVAKRREMLREIGPNVGRIDAVWARSYASFSEAERKFYDRYRDMAISQMVGEVLALGQWQLKGEVDCR